MSRLKHLFSWPTTSLLSWLSLVIYINTVSPQPHLHRLIFFLIFFVGLFSTASIFIKKIKIRSFLVFYLLSLLLAQYLRLLGWINLSLITALYASIFWLVK